MKKVYQDKTKEEIKLLIDSFKDLTIDRKKSLVEFLDAEEDLSSYGVDMAALKEAITKEEKQIDSFAYLDNLGFEFLDNGTHQVLQRSYSSHVINYITLFIGILLSIMLPFGLGVMFEMSTTEVVDSDLAMQSVLMIPMGVVGALLLFRAASRMENFKGFKFERHGQQMSLFKKNKLVYQTANPEDLQISMKDESMAMYLSGPDEEKYTLMEVDRPNIYFRRTIHRLREQLLN